MANRPAYDATAQAIAMKWKQLVGKGKVAAGLKKSAAVLDQAGFNDARDQIHIDVAARDDYANVLTGERNFLVEQSRERHGRRALGDGFFDFEQRQDGIRDFAFAHRDDFIDIIFHQLERCRADRTHGDAVGDRR